MKLTCALTFDKIRHDQDKTCHLVISVEAPCKDGEASRAPICVVPVIDVSGSMAGDKLEYAKRSALKLIDHLRPGDYTGLIAFESNVHVVIPPQKITAATKDKLKAAVHNLAPRGGTNFSGGMLKAIELVQALDLPDGVMNRIIMLTDGQANEGSARNPADIIKVCQANAGRVTASAFGFGLDVSQEFLGDFATAAKGNYAYIKDPDGALTAFGKELGGLISTYATDLEIDVNALAGHEITSVVSDVLSETEQVGGEMTIKVPEILAEERRDITLAVTLKAGKTGIRPVNVFESKLRYSVIAEDGKKEQRTLDAKAKAQFVKAGDEDKKPIAALDKIAALADMTRAQINAEEKAKKGDFVGAAAVMNMMAADIGERGYVQLQAAARHTAGSVGDAHSYQHQQGYLRSMRLGGTRGMGVASSDASAQSLLEVAGVQYSNSSQTSTSASFVDQGVVMLPDLLTHTAIAGAVPAVWTTDPPGIGIVGNPILIAPIVASPLVPQTNSPLPGSSGVK